MKVSPDAGGGPVGKLGELFPACLHDQLDLVLRLFADHNFLVQILIH